MLRVGPESAGSTPGPVCYGRGGTRVTISDANLILGRLPASRFGQAAEAAFQAMREQIAVPLGLSVEQAAEAVIRIANTHMAGAIRMVSISMGADPRDFALFAFGGAGPLACRGAGARTERSQGPDPGPSRHHQRAWLRRRRPAA
jgi:N-methylhydantoinase A